MSDPVFGPGDKGIPGHLMGEPVSSLVGLNVTDAVFPSPQVVAYQDRIAHNIDLMSRWCRHHGCELAPHAKTAMSPQLALRQLEAGAAGVAVATTTQARVMQAAGVRRIILANQLVNKAGIAWAAQALESGIDLAAFVDSSEGLHALRNQAMPVPLSVLIEIGAAGGRTGVRSIEQAVSLGRKAAALPGVRVAGIAGYEGVFLDQASSDPRRGVRAFLGQMAAAFEAVAEQSLFDSDKPPVLTAGGSACFDDVAEMLVPVAERFGGQVVLRSGCYLTHDHGLYEEVSPLGSNDRWPSFLPAIEVFCQVLSRPEPGLALLDAGRRDMSFDAGLPRPVGRGRIGQDRSPVPESWRVVSLMDQHAFLTIGHQDPLNPGDYVVLGISHPCTTFDKWRFIPEINASGTVTNVISTSF